MAGRLRRLLALPAAERLALARAYFLVLAVRLALWVLPFRTVRRLIGRVAARPAGSGQHPALPPERVAWTVRAASRYVPNATCLPRALAAYTLLRRQGVPATMHIGVKKSASGELKGHAWVELEGRVLVGGTSSPTQFKPLLAMTKASERDSGTVLPG